MSQEEYDFIFAGGGAAGLGLAYHIGQSSLPHRRMLVIDRDAKDRNDRTWCFWSPDTTPYDHLTYHSWDKVEFVSDHFRQVYDLHPYRYRMVRGIDFYQGMRSALNALPEVHFVQGFVGEVQNYKNSAQVMVDNRIYQGKWIFDSTFKPADFTGGPAGYHYLMQHFKGWEIETPNDSFDPETVTLFDFRTPQLGSMRFFYILPFSRRRALVEYTLFSAQVLKSSEYDRAISEYIEHVLRIPSYRIESVESGIIPMTDRPFPRKIGSRVMTIGTKGGLVKPSSGYAFLRMQKDSAAIVHSLAQYGHPFAVPRSPARYRLFDSVMLQVMLRQGDLTEAVFTRMFQNNTIQGIFRFLDEVAPLQENLRLLASLQKSPFLKALFRIKLLGRI